MPMILVSMVPDYSADTLFMEEAATKFAQSGSVQKLSEVSIHVERVIGLLKTNTKFCKELSHQEQA